MHRYKDVMVALARTDADAELIRYAEAVARLGVATRIRFVHVVPQSADPSIADHGTVVGALEKALQSHFTYAHEALRVSCEVLQGPKVDQLLTYAAEQQVDLMLVGGNQPAGSRRSLARRLAMKAPCSVWVAPRAAPATITRILVPVDFSEHAADAMRVATSMARLQGRAECVALHVYFNEAVTSFEGYDQVLRGQEAKAYAQFIAAIDRGGVTVTPVFEEGPNVAHVIARVAERESVDLIVMATRGRSRSAAILLGSETEQTLIETRIPLLAVKHYGARMGVLESLLDRKFWKQGAVRAD